MNDNGSVAVALDQTASLLERLRLRHAFGGALAQNFWGVIRATQDVDVLVLVPALRFQEVVDEMTAAGFRARDRDGKVTPITVSAARESLRTAGLFVVWLGLVKVEVFTPVLPLQDRILERAVSMPWRDRTIPVTTAEDLIVLKMIFHREKDLGDIRAMVAVSGKQLDQTYLLEQASQVLPEAAMTELRGLLAGSS